MAGWQQELAELLQELGVTPEEPQTNLHTSSVPQVPDGSESWYSALHGDPVADAALYAELEEEEAARYALDLGAMGREVDAIVQQVSRLTRRGGLEQSAKDDILEVLRALRKFSVVAQQVAPGDEAYLESVSAMLRFCRLVLRLSETTIEGY